MIGHAAPRKCLTRDPQALAGEELEDLRRTHGPGARDPGEHGIVHLSVGGMAERVRPGKRREPVLAAWRFTASGAMVRLLLMAGSKEDAEAVTAFFQEMRARGLGTPLSPERPRRFFPRFSDLTRPIARIRSRDS